MNCEKIRMDFDYEVAIFDMDGTLLDTMPYWRFTGLEYILAHGLPVLPDYISRMYDQSSRTLLLEYADEIGIEMRMPEVIPELEDFMERHYIHDARIKPYVKEFLELLKSKGIRMCVATGSPRQYARKGLERVGILDYFEFVTDNYEAPFTKDQPAYFENLAKRLGVAPEKCMVFEDALYSIESAKAAGMRICGLEDGTQKSTWPGIKAASEVYINNFGQLLHD